MLCTLNYPTSAPVHGIRPVITADEWIAAHPSPVQP